MPAGNLTFQILLHSKNYGEVLNCVVFPLNVFFFHCSKTKSERWSLAWDVFNVITSLVFGLERKLFISPIQSETKSNLP